MGDGRAVAQRIGTTESVDQATALTLDLGAELIGARATGVYLFGATGIEVLSRGIVERDIERYQSYCATAADPLLVHMARELTAVHNLMLYTKASWMQQAVYDIAIAPAGLCHYQVSPLFRDGKMIGALTFGRSARDGAFDITSLSRGSALAACLSSKLAARGDAIIHELSNRQRAVVTLVAKGLTNAEIANALDISVDYVKKILKDVFARVGVTTRAELAGIVAHEVL